MQSKQSGLESTCQKIEPSNTLNNKQSKWVMLIYKMSSFGFLAWPWRGFRLLVVLKQSHNSSAWAGPRRCPLALGLTLSWVTLSLALISGQLQLSTGLGPGKQPNASRGNCNRAEEEKRSVCIERSLVSRAVLSVVPWSFFFQANLTML